MNEALTTNNRNCTFWSGVKHTNTGDISISSISFNTKHTR
jgi:hypothetical protein